MYSKTLPLFLVCISISCKSNDSAAKIPVNAVHKTRQADVNPYVDIAAIPVPAGYKRFDTAANSFSYWLDHLRLKRDKTVYLFDGTKKSNQSAQFAVLDIPVGNKNLQQCADAVMRLRASFLYDQKKFDAIVFYDNEGKAYRFSKPYDPSNFDHYLQSVFAVCGTASLAKQLKKVDFTDIKPGDVLIRGGFPGHAVMVMDVVKNKAGCKKYMLAQSYMPAQNIHILLNPYASEATPWYDVNDEDTIETPEYTFYSFELKSW